MKTISRKAQKPSRDVEKCQLIQKVSQKVYKSLRGSGTKHTEHLIHFCLDAVAVDNGDISQVQFKLAFTYMTLQGFVSNGDPVWFLIESILGHTP